jgi:hypothetical protein
MPFHIDTMRTQFACCPGAVCPKAKERRFSPQTTEGELGTSCEGFLAPAGNRHSSLKIQQIRRWTGVARQAAGRSDETRITSFPTSVFPPNHAHWHLQRYPAAWPVFQALVRSVRSRTKNQNKRTSRVRETWSLLVELPKQSFRVAGRVDLMRVRRAPFQ